MEVAGKVYNWPLHWPDHYKALTVHLLIRDYKVKWIDNETLVTLSPTPIRISTPNLEDLVESEHFLWPDHQRILNEILTMAKTAA